MSDYVGKKFEQKFISDWLKTEGAYIYRLKDIMSGYRKVSNISDFVGYLYPYMYLIELKSTKGNTFNFAKLTQYDQLKTARNVPGLNVGVIIWFYEKDKVCYVPIEECVRLKEKLAKKSIHVQMIDNSDYEVYEIPSEKKRKYMDSNYSIMKNIADIKYNKLYNR